VTLATVHGAKGTEHDHVMIVGDWSNLGTTRQAEEEERRTLYVGMTRARQTLAIFDRRDRPSLLFDPLRSGSTLCRKSDATCPNLSDLTRRYELLTLSDLFINYASCFDGTNPIHAALSQLAAGDTLRLRPGEKDLDLITTKGRAVAVARFSAAGTATWRPRLGAVQEVRVLAMIRRYRTDGDPEYQAKCRVDRWELPVCEVVTNSPRS
jgi:hypothetical protein